MQKNLYIFIQLPGGGRSVVGRLLYEKLADGLVQSYFRYEPSWVTHPDGFPLDPVNLPLKTSLFHLKSRTGLWGVLEDALPDAWGRRLLQARHMVNVSQDNNIALLLLMEWAEPGATGFSNSLDIANRIAPAMDMEMTDQAITASEAFEKNAELTNLPDFFISGGSSAGGARPKVLARSGENQYLVKFPSINDPTPSVMARLEFFGMSCIQQAGIPVPDFFLVKASKSRMALAVKRFDTVAVKGRLHFLSFQSLTGVEEQLGLPYSRMADIIKKVSANPEEDLHNLYKQMIVNIIICNRDDHLKNFSMIYTPAVHRFCLTPAYDVVPNLWQKEHILSVSGKTRNITIEDIIREGNNFSLSDRRCLQLLDEARQGVIESFEKNNNIIRPLSSSHPLCRQLIDNIKGNIDIFKIRQKRGGYED